MLKEKIRNGKSGILLYGIVPPKITSSQDELERLGTAWSQRLSECECDGIVIYDLQDESARTKDERTFPFVHTIDPARYYTQYLHTDKEAIIYRAVGKYGEAEFCEILRHAASGLGVFVGASSKNEECKLHLSRAYEIKRLVAPHLCLGGICIPERHEKSRDEHLKIAEKTADGCEFFITQAVYNVQNAKDFIDDYAALECKRVPIIFTFTPCGSLKTLEFMKWLGISVPDFLQQRLQSSVDILQSSTALCAEMFDFIYKYALAKGVSVGANVESVSTRRVEIEASLSLLKEIRKIILKHENLGFYVI